MELESGNIDCIWNGFTMTGREDDYTWTEPYMANQQVFVVANDSDISSQADLAGKIVEVSGRFFRRGSFKRGTGTDRYFQGASDNR